MRSLQKSENQVKRGDRSCQMKSTQTPSLDSLHHLRPVDKKGVYILLVPHVILAQVLTG